VLPDNVGGDAPFVETSAATGKGIDELLESLSLVAELKELKANPNKPAVGANTAPGGRWPQQLAVLRKCRGR
jgi:translation initiation factor IF-2